MKTRMGLTLLAFAAALGLGGASLARGAQSDEQNWQEEFGIADRTLSDTGESEFFILMPGFQLTLESERAVLTITVLDETKEIGGISTRIVEERESIDGALYEISRNFYAIDEENGDVFYFGEEVDFFDRATGKITGHAGEWTAFEDENKPGMIMSGAPEVGMKYYQEVAPGEAMDRAEVINVTETYDTPAGEFKNCLVTLESSKIEPGVLEFKTYARGIGLIQDQALKLVSYGYIEETGSQ